jgi:hypothetical protein
MKVESSLILLLFLVSAVVEAADRPNFLRITCEDISPYLGCYGFEQAHTPNLDRLAAEGIRHTHAYANAPVCAVARAKHLLANTKLPIEHVALAVGFTDAVHIGKTFQGWERTTPSAYRKSHSRV